MIQNATVKRILTDSKAEIGVFRESACGHDCASCGGGCASNLRPEMIVAAENPLDAKVGNRVLVETSSRRILGAAALLYLIPFATFFAAYFLADSWTVRESSAIGIGMIGFLFGLIPVWLLNGYWKKKKPNFKIVEILND